MTQEQLPQYRCHKVVGALKIKSIQRPGMPGEECIITPEEEGFKPFPVSEDFLRRHRPHEGGYYVVYADGYVSFSPAGAFEGGYTKI